MTAQRSKTQTIPLTNRPPVRIREDAWPVIARGSYRAHDGREYEYQASHGWRADVRVRQHADGRAIVYGTYDYSSASLPEHDFRVKAGLLLDKGADLIRAIRIVGSDLMRATRDAARAAGDHTYASTDAHILEAVITCIEDLPPVELE